MIHAALDDRHINGLQAKPSAEVGIQALVTCREFADFMMDYLSGELPASTRRRFVRHLRVCPNCCRYLASYEQTVRLGRLAFDDSAALPDDVPEELVAAILSAGRRP